MTRRNDLDHEKLGSPTTRIAARLADEGDQVTTMGSQPLGREGSRGDNAKEKEDEALFASNTLFWIHKASGCHERTAAPCALFWQF